MYKTLDEMDRGINAAMNRKSDELINFAEKETSIEFVPFESPDYQSLKEEQFVSLDILAYKFSIGIDNESNKIYTKLGQYVPYGANAFCYVKAHEWFDNTQGGLKQACDWLNTKKYELAEQIAGA